MCVSTVLFLLGGCSSIPITWGCSSIWKLGRWIVNFLLAKGSISRVRTGFHKVTGSNKCHTRNWQSIWGCKFDLLLGKASFLLIWRDIWSMFFFITKSSVLIFKSNRIYFKRFISTLFSASNKPVQDALLNDDKSLNFSISIPFAELQSFPTRTKRNHFHQQQTPQPPFKFKCSSGRNCQQLETSILLSSSLFVHFSSTVGFII